MQALPRSSISRWPIRTSLSSAPLSSPRAAFVCASCQLSMQHRQTRGPSQRQRRSYASTAPLREQTRSGTSPATTTTTTTTTTTAPLPPAPPPSSGYARLRTRRLISMSGADAPHFLQGLVTTSVEGATAAAGRRTARTAIPWSYCGFLNALGRVLHDVFIYPAPSPRPDGGGGGGGGDPHFVIEVDAAQLTTLLKHLKRYKLRSKIALRAVDEDEMSVWQVWNDDDHDGNGYDYGDGDGDGDGRAVILRDPRAPGMGYRVLAAGADLDAQAAAGSPLGELLRLRPEGVDEGAYRVRRYLRGVAEGGAEIVPAQALPQESNLDAMGGIDFRKGCYVGQELTIRTRHRGVVRKRVLPCVLYGPDDPIPTSLEYRPDAAAAAATALATIGGGGGVGGDMRGLTIGRLGKRGRSTGTFLAGVGNIGLALCRVQLMSDLVVPNDTAALEFDPTAEFVIQPSKSEDGEAAAAAAAVGSVGKETVKVKAFVPDWLRRRLDEDTIKHHQQ